jgi:hypothetical protein
MENENCLSDQRVRWRCRLNGFCPRFVRFDRPPTCLFMTAMQCRLPPWRPDPGAAERCGRPRIEPLGMPRVDLAIAASSLAPPSVRKPLGTARKADRRAGETVRPYRGSGGLLQRDLGKPISTRLALPRMLVSKFMPTSTMIRCRGVHCIAHSACSPVRLRGEGAGPGRVL